VRENCDAANRDSETALEGRHMIAAGTPSCDFLLTTKRTALDVRRFLGETGNATLHPLPMPNEGLLAWVIEAPGCAYFLKWGDPQRYAERLSKDVAICSADLHPAIIRRYNVIETNDGFLLVFEKAKGGTLYGENRRRFFALPLARKLRALRVIFDAEAAIVDAGWVLQDFFEGNVLYDFDSEAVKVFDFEFYQRGDGFVLQTERTYGSSRLRPPESNVRGAWIDQTSNVYELGRYAINALSARIDEGWRSELHGSAALADVLERATRPDRTERYPTVRAFVRAFEEASSKA
jgi:serine/threonine-protein kinase